MKPWIYRIIRVGLCLLAVGVHAANSVVVQPATVVEKGPHHQTWQYVTLDEVGGEQVQQTHSYVELKSGMNVWSPSENKWVEASAEIELFPRGAIARKAQHQVIFSPTSTDPAGTIDLLMPGNKRLRSRILGIAFTEIDTGRSVFVAELKERGGILVGNNRVEYPDAFDDIRADARYTMNLATFEQDVVLQEQLPSPETVGMVSRNTQVEVWTEFLQAPSPRRQALRHADDPIQVDEQLDFGPDSLFFGLSEVFFASPQAGGALESGPLQPPTMGRGSKGLESIRADKRWAQIDNRSFLIESVPFEQLSQLLAHLPKHVAAANSRASLLKRLASKRARPHERQTPVSLVQASDHPARAARSTVASIKRGRGSIGPGVVLDYVLVNGATGYTFQSDTTYYTTGDGYYYGTTTFEKGTVIKFGPTTPYPFPRIVLFGPLNLQTQPYRPMILTAKDDDTVGEIIYGSTGTPSGYYAGNEGLLLWTYYQTAIDVHDIRFTYLNGAFNPGYEPQVTFRNSQIVRCGYGIPAGQTGNLYVRNILSWNCNNHLYGGYGRAIRVENATFNGGGQLINNFDGTGSFYLTNCLIVAVGSTGGTYSGSNNQTLTSTNGIFQPTGAGYNYLAADSPYRNIGSTNINSQLLADLKARTTYPPVILTNDFKTDTILFPQAQRDTDLPDLGYHYDPLDYCVSNLKLTSASLGLTNGVAVGVYGTNGIVLDSGGVFSSEGTPVNLNQFGRYSLSQEQPVLWGPTAGQLSLLSVVPSPSVLPKASFRFTQISAIANDLQKRYLLEVSSNNLPGSVTFNDCRIHNVRVILSPTGDSRQCMLAMTNNLIERGYFSPSQTVGGSPLAVYLWNNLFTKATATLMNYTNNAQWAVYNNFFDTHSYNYGSVNFPNGTNAFYASSIIPGSSGGDITLSLAPEYQTGPLGSFYYPTSGTNLYRLVDAGSRSAANAGLYHHTVRVDQTKESTSWVDIGFHYVALNGQNLPVDTDSDGLPDYLEDSNGNGSLNSGETDWNSASDAGFKVTITKPKSSSNLP